MNPLRKRAAPPAPGDTVSYATEDLGEPVHAPSIGPAKSVVRPIPSGQITLQDAGEPVYPKPLVPTPEEILALPAAARAAFAARCADQVMRAAADTPRARRAVLEAQDPADAVTAVERAAEAIVLAATTRTPVGRTLRRLRRDFDRLARRARDEGWTDGTPVPADAFGPPR